MIQERMMPEGKHASDDLMISHHMARYDWAIESKKITGKKILDLGCGEGYGTNMLRQAGYDTSGMDISPDVVAAAKQKYGGDFFQGDIRQIPQPAATYDSIVCFEVIEHIELDPRAFSEMFRILKPGGTLIISTPNVETYIEAGQHPYHFHEFTRPEMEQCLTTAGFRSSEMFGQGTTHPVVTGFYQKPWLKAYIRLKRAIGLSGPLMSKSIVHAAEKLTTGHTTADWKSSKIWSFIPNDAAAEMMLFVAKKST